MINILSTKSPVEKNNPHTVPMVLFLAVLAATFFTLRMSGSMPRARAAAIVQNSVPVASVSAASFIGSPAPLAPNSIVAAFGTQLATGTQGASTQPLPTSILDTTVTVNDVAAPLFFVSPGQVNYLVPPNMPAGDVQVVITSTLSNGDQIVSRGQMNLAQFAPAIFTANANGFGPPAAVTGRVNANGEFVFDPNPPFEPDPLNPTQVIPRPIDVGTNERPAFLILFGTGLRNAPPDSMRAIIGGVEVPVTPLVAPGFTGLDQVNLQIPTSLSGSGSVDLTLVANGISSNAVRVNLAGTPNSNLSVTGFSVTEPALAGQTVTIQGSGFSTTPNQNIVRFGSAQARAIASTANQMTVIVPFGAESGPVTVQTPQGEARSPAVFRVRTSVSGIVQSTGSISSPPAPLEGVTLRLVGTSSIARSNPQGSFVMPDLTPGPAQIEVDGNTVDVNPPFPRVTLKLVVRADRDNQFEQPISLQQINGGSANVGGGSGFADGSQLANGSPQLLAALRQRESTTDNTLSTKQQVPAPAKTIEITHRGVTLELSVNTAVRLPNGKTSGQMQLTVLEGSRLPGISLPTGVFSSTIAMITPLGSTFSPGASLKFPNPDPANLPPGAKVVLYRFDPRSGVFIKRGTATVSPDRTMVISDGLVVDLASFWLAAAPAAVTSVIGRVIDGLSSPVPGAKLSVNGRTATSDQNGGFNIPDVGTTGSQQIQVEAVLPQQFGTPPRGTSAITTAVAGGVTNVGTIALSNTNQPGLVLSPFAISLSSNAPPARVEVTLTQPAPAGGLAISLASNNTNVATVPANVLIAAGQTIASFNVTSVGPGVALIQARAALSGNTLETTAVVTVARPAPRLTGVNPQAAPPGAKITIQGVGFSTVSRNNIIGFVRNNNLVALLQPDDNETMVDPAGAIAVGVVVPSLSPGMVGIVAAVVDNATGVISDTSTPLNFNVLPTDIASPQLANVSPAQGNPRTQVTISGIGFSQTAGENSVIFRQDRLESAARIIRATPTALVVEVPSNGISRGPATIIARRIAPNGALSNPSNALDFMITGDPNAPPKPSLTSIINTTTQTASGRDGNTVQATGTDFGTNFFDVNKNALANDDPLISLLLFYQNNQLINFTIPIGAMGGTQLTAVIPTGLSMGGAQITTATFDLETGLVSEESAPVNFTITVGSLRRIDEDEPNDSPRAATEVFLQTIVTGAASKDDPGDLVIRFNDMTTETLHDLFLLKLDKLTSLTLTLSFDEAADLDLFVLAKDERGGFRVIGSSTANTGTMEGLAGMLSAGDYLIAVGSFRGSSGYSLAILQGLPTVNEFGPMEKIFRYPTLVESKNK